MYFLKIMELSTGKTWEEVYYDLPVAKKRYHRVNHGHKLHVIACSTQILY